MPPADWSFLSPALAGNLCGLAGTALLAWGALRAIPIAAALYRISSDLDALERQRLAIEEAAEQAIRKEQAIGKDQGARPTGPGASAHPDDSIRPELAEKLRRSIEATREALDQTAREMTSIRDQWTRRDTVLTLAGLILTLASDALPLLALLTSQTAPPAP